MDIRRTLIKRISHDEKIKIYCSFINDYKPITKDEYKELSDSVEKNTILIDKLFTAHRYADKCSSLIIKLFFVFFVIGVLSRIQTIEFIKYCFIFIGAFLMCWGFSSVIISNIYKMNRLIDEKCKKYGVRNINFCGFKKLGYREFEEISVDQYLKVEYVASKNDILRNKIKNMLVSGDREELVLFDYEQLGIDDLFIIYKGFAEDLIDSDRTAKDLVLLLKN